MKIKVIFIVFILHTPAMQGAATLSMGTIAAYEYLRDLWDETFPHVMMINPPPFNPLHVMMINPTPFNPPPSDTTFIISEEDWRLYILELINSIAPELYNAIIIVDPTGQNHIVNENSGNMHIHASNEDYLPIIFIDKKKMAHISREVLKAGIAHELAHYALGHDIERNKISLKHEFLLPTKWVLYKDCLLRTRIKGRKVQISGKFNASPVFQGSSGRIREHEADRFAVLQLKTPIKNLIQTLEEFKYTLSKELFISTHPSWEQRIEHIKSLAAEVELQKTHSTNTTPINWDAIIENYRKAEDQRKMRH